MIFDEQEMGFDLVSNDIPALHRVGNSGKPHPKSYVTDNSYSLILIFMMTFLKNLPNHLQIV